MNYHHLSPEQQSAVRHPAAKLVIIAGPGSGKTTVLSNRIIHQIETDIFSALDVAAVTFTNSAGSQLAQRIDELRPGTKLGYIGTIHGLALRMLERHGALIGYRAGIAVIDDDQARDALRDMAELIGHAKLSTSKLVATRDMLGTDARLMKPMTPEALVVASYYKRLHANNATDYRGLISEATRALQKVEARSFYVLHIDEAQDMSRSDWGFLRLLLPHDGMLTLVGDPDQAIFAFRGGDMRQFIEIANGAGVERVYLETNYRSDRAICDAAQNLIEHNKARIAKRTVPASTGFGTLEMMEPAENEETEAGNIFTKIAFMLSKAEAKPEQIAVLARTNEIAKRLREIAEIYDVPVERVESVEETPGWPFARACIELLATPRNDLVAEHFVVLRDGKEVAQKMRAKAALLQKPISEVYFAGALPASTVSDLAAYVAARFGAHPQSANRIARICESLPPDSTISDVVLALRIEKQTEERGKGVAVTTMHAAKGREWPIVFLAGMEQETIPGKSAKVDPEEERRVAYVAITRAEHALFISQARKRNVTFSRVNRYPTSPSIFTLEMMKALPEPAGV